MIVDLHLTKDEETRLLSEAARKGVPADELVTEAVKTLIPDIPGHIQAKLDNLAALMDGDEEEHRETGEYLMNALDEDRLSYRKLYPWRV